MKKITGAIIHYFKALFSPVNRGAGSAELVDTMRIFNAIFLIRVFGLIVNILTLPFRSNLPEAMYLAFQYAFYPLFAYNILLFLLQKKVYALLKRHHLWILVDILVSVGVLFIGAGWRSSYFAYTISTIALATLFAHLRGTILSCLIMGLVAFFKEPNVYGNDILIFNATSLDMRLGAAIFYVTAGVILGYFNHLLRRIQGLSQEKIEAVKRHTAAEQKMRLAADLHDHIKSKITAILLLYRPLLKDLFARKTNPRTDLLKLWKWLNYLQEETHALFSSLKSGTESPAEKKRLDLVEIIQGELKIMGDITDFRWSFIHQPKTLRLPVEKIPPLRRFLGEAVLNAWKHSGAREGLILLNNTAGEIQLAIRDRGRGFDGHVLRRASGHGLKSLRQRAEDLGGELAVESKPGRGVEITLTFPLGRNNQAIR